MRVISNILNDDRLTITTLERERDEDLIAFVGDGMYQIGPYILSGHDIGVMDRVYWDAVAQEWKVAKP